LRRHPDKHRKHGNLTTCKQSKELVFEIPTRGPKQIMPPVFVWHKRKKKRKKRETTQAVMLPSSLNPTQAALMASIQIQLVIVRRFG